MSLLARVLAVIAALVGAVAALAGLVRAAAMAGDERLVWDLPDWWTGLTDASGWAVGIAAAAVAAAAIVYLIVALRELEPARPPASLQIGGVQVRPAALERLVATRLAAEIAGLTPVRVRVTRHGAGWDVEAAVDVPPNDLTGLRDRAVRVVRAELAGAAGGGLAGLDLEVRRFAGRPSPPDSIPR